MAPFQCCVSGDTVLAPESKRGHYGYMTTVAESPTPPRADSAGDVLLSYVAEHLQKLKLQEPRVRREEPDAVHQMRVASRRLRSALATYRPLLEGETASGLRSELRWLAGVLGASRDIQVIEEGLSDRLAAESAYLIVGPITQRISDKLDADFEAARQQSAAALDSVRFRRLIAALDAFLAAPPLTEEASEPARRIVPRRIRKEWEKLQKLVRVAEETQPGSQDRDLALHEVRKRTKRLRYAAETAIPVRKKPARELADAARDLQSSLGTLQDSIVARDLLLRLAVSAQLRGESAFSYGRLHAVEQGRAAASEEAFHRAWKNFDTPSIID